MASFSGNRLSGLALVVGTILGVAASLFTPGTLFIDMVDQVNIRDRLDVLVDYAFLTHLTASAGIIALVLLLMGLYALWPRGDNSDGGVALRRAGIIALTASIVIAMGALSLPHIEVHIFDHQFASGVEGDPSSLAYSLELMGAGLMFSAIIASYMAHTFLALGLASKFTSDGRKLAARLIALIAALGLIAFLIGAHNHELVEIAVIGAFGILITSAWTLALGVWLMREDPQITE